MFLAHVPPPELSESYFGWKPMYTGIRYTFHKRDATNVLPSGTLLMMVLRVAAAKMKQDWQASHPTLVAIQELVPQLYGGSNSRLQDGKADIKLTFSSLLACIRVPKVMACT